MTNPQANKKVRDISLDLIRFIAILMVISIHVSAAGFGFMDKAHWWAINTYESMSRVSVPLFFMVSGVLLLPKEHTVNSILSRLLRILVPLIIWSIIYLLWYRYVGMHFTGWFARILRAPVVAHFWYLYALIGAYLFLPVMSGFFNIKDLKVQSFTMFFWFIGASITPTIYSLTGNSYIGISWDFLSLYAGYMILGALLYKKVKIKITKVIILLFAALYIVCFMLIAILTWMNSLRVNVANETFYVYSSPFVVLGAIGLFLFIKSTTNYLIKKDGLVYRFLIFQGKASFGIYLIHVLIIWIFDRLGFTYDFINPWFAVPLLIIATYFISLLIIHIIQRVPILRYIAPM